MSPDSQRLEKKRKGRREEKGKERKKGSRERAVAGPAWTVAFRRRFWSSSSPDFSAGGKRGGEKKGRGTEEKGEKRKVFRLGYNLPMRSWRSSSRTTLTFIWTATREREEEKEKNKEKRKKGREKGGENEAATERFVFDQGWPS